MNLTLATVFAIVFAFGTLRWREAVPGAMVLAIFEGALRKWVFPEEQQWVYLVKDVLLLGAYAGFFGPRLLRRRQLIPRHPANPLLAAVALIALLQLLNPELPSPLVGLFGIKAYLMYVPLMYMVPAAVEDAAGLRRLSLGYLALALIPLGLGFLQFGAPPDSVLNRYAWEEEVGPRVAGFAGTDSVRITGTFSYMSGYTTYLTLVFLLALAVAAAERTIRLRLALYGLLALTVANVLMTGARGAIMLLAIAVPTLIALLRRSGQAMRSRALLTACVAVPLTGIVAGALFPQAREAFLIRARESEDIPGRLAGIVQVPLWALQQAGLSGYGIGSTHQARAYLLAGGLVDDRVPEAEGEPERIILEVGPVGFLLVIGARVLVSWRLWTAFRALQGSVLRPYLAVALVFTLARLPLPLVFNHTASVFYWFLAGLGLVTPSRRAHLPTWARHAEEARAVEVGKRGWGR